MLQEFQISNSGFKQILAHSSGKKHQDLAKGQFGLGQRYFNVKPPVIQDTEKPSSQQEMKSEIIVNKSAKEAATQATLLILFM